jgi:hypothetical protein
VQGASPQATGEDRYGKCRAQGHTLLVSVKGPPCYACANCSLLWTPSIGWHERA